MANNKVLKVGIVSTLSMIVLGGVYSFFRFQNDKKDIEVDNPTSLVESVKENGISLKTLSTATLANGVIRKTMTYEITPNNSNNKLVKAKIYYKDNVEEDASKVISAQIDHRNMILMFDCYKDFDRQIEATITSIDNEKAQAKITFDYYKRIKGVIEDESYFATSDDEISSESKVFNLPEVTNLTYYSYTVDKEYTFTVNKEACNISYNWQCQDYNAENYCFEHFFNLLIDKIVAQGATPTSQEIVNCVPEQYRSEWVSFLVDDPFDDNKPLQFSFEFVCNETQDKYYGTTSLIFYSGNIFNQYIIHVDNVTLEVDNIIF